MPIEVKIVGSDGQTLKVNGEHQIETVVHQHPPRDESEIPLPFRQYLTDNGTSSGSNDMKVDGSTNNVEFCISAIPDADLYIKTISVVIADAGATLNKFGNITALTNGLEFKWLTQDFGEVIIHEALKTNFDFVRLANGKPSFGDAAGAFRASNVFGTSEAYIPSIDLGETFSVQWGLRLRKGTTDKICFIIKDNVTGVDLFDAIGYGIKW